MSPRVPRGLDGDYCIFAEGRPLPDETKHGFFTAKGWHHIANPTRGGRTFLSNFSLASTQGLPIKWSIAVEDVFIITNVLLDGLLTVRYDGKNIAELPLDSYVDVATAVPGRTALIRPCLFAERHAFGAKAEISGSKLDLTPHTVGTGVLAMSHAIERMLRKNAGRCAAEGHYRAGVNESWGHLQELTSLLATTPMLIVGIGGNTTTHYV